MFNFRDIGGIPAAGGTVRRGRLLRSDALVGLDPADHEQMAALQIRTAIDLREPGERQHSPHELRDVEVHELPLIDGGLDGSGIAGFSIDLLAFNRWMLEQRGERLVEVVRRLGAVDAQPAAFFCSSGKDRTGIVAALVLSAVGVEDEAVVADYVRTEALLPEWYIPHAIERALAGGLTEDLIDDYRTHGLGAPAAVMRGTLALLAERGGAAAYLIDHGLSPTELDALRAGLVDAG